MGVALFMAYSHGSKQSLRGFWPVVQLFLIIIVAVVSDYGSKALH